MPIGDYKNFGECVADQIKKGHSEESAKKICGKIEQNTKENAAEWVRSNLSKEDGGHAI
jgi:hypothetical protein